MIKREVREELLAKLKISKQALSKRAKRLKENHGPMTTDEAVYIIAHMEGIDLSRHLSLEILDRIRSLIPKEIKHQSDTRPETLKKTRPKNKKKNKISYPLVTDNVIRKANQLGEDVFPRIFILENSIRALIKQRLSALQTDWWKALVPKLVQENVERTIKKELKHPYREKRGAELLMYCNFDDLRKIIADENNYPNFQDAIINLEWFKVKMEEVYMARNNLAHSTPLSKDDITTINLFYNQWARLLESARIK